MRINAISSHPFFFAILALAANAVSISPDAIGQGIYNESNLYINGADIFIDGEIQNSGNIDNRGMVYVTGDWDNEGNYTGDGVFEFAGPSSQIISHNDQKVRTVIVSGAGPKYLKGSLNITDALHLNYGILHVSGDASLQMDARARIFGGHEDSFVDGPITATGTGYKFFPTGKNGTYAPIAFEDVQGRPATYKVEVFEEAPAISVENVIIRHAIYWQRTDLHGQFGGSKVSATYDPAHYSQPENMRFVTGVDWDQPFMTVSNIPHPTDANKLTTNLAIVAPLILLGEISDTWKEADLYFSTALSPHAAFSENRSVKLFGERMVDDQFRFQVFNRWGKLVYESTSRDEMAANGWDGRTFGGQALGSGAYPYRISGFDKMGMKLEKKGVITIIH